MTCDEFSDTTRHMEKKTQSYKDLVVWQKGIALAKLVYTITTKFPNEEKFGLVAQMRRAAVSIPSNIAEGQARHTTGEFIQFISHSEGSVAELNTQFTLAVELGFCSAKSAAPAFELMEDLRRMLNGLRRKLSGQTVISSHVTRHMSLLIRNGEIVTPNEQYVADIFCEGETITRIERDIQVAPDAEVIDASGKYVFPGFIDPHVHIYLPFMGTSAKDNHETASRAALVGGTTTFIEMICPARTDRPMEAFELWLGKTRR